MTNKMVGLLGGEEDKAQVSRFSFGSVSYLSPNNHLIQQSTKVGSFKAKEYLGMRWEVVGVAAVSFALFAILSIVALLQLSTGSISKVSEIETFAQKHPPRDFSVLVCFRSCSGMSWRAGQT